MTALALSLLIAAFGCGDDSPTDAPPPPIDSGAISDSGATADSGVTQDAATPEPDASVSADTWSTFASGFLDTYCVECHAGAPSGRDYQTIDDVRRDASTIRCGTVPAAEPASGCGSTPAAGMFPVGAGARPSDEERRRLLAWIDDGLPE